jgi:hypothetical protein
MAEPAFKPARTGSAHLSILKRPWEARRRASIETSRLRGSTTATDPAALQLQLLQAAVEVAAEKNSSLVMPVPVELLRPLTSHLRAGQQADGESR